MKVKHILTAAVLAFSVLTSGAFAQEGENFFAKPSTENSGVTVAGTELEANSLFAIYVLKPGKTAADLDLFLNQGAQGSIKDVLVTAEHTHSNSSGEVSVDLKMTGATGRYNVCLVSANGSVKKDTSFYWIENIDEFTDEIERQRVAFAAAKAANDEAAMANCVNEIRTVLSDEPIRKAFGIYDSENVGNVSFENIPQAVFEKMADRAARYERAADVKSAFREGSIVCYFNSLSADEFLAAFEEYKAELNGFNEKIYAVYKELQTENPAEFNAVCTQLENREFGKTEEISSALCEYVVLKYVSLMQNYSEIMPFIEKIQNAAGLNLSLYETVKSPHNPENILKAVILKAKSYKTLKEFVDDFEAETKKELARSTDTGKVPVSGGGGSSSGGGGGSASGGSGSYIPTAINSQNSNNTNAGKQENGFNDVKEDHWAYSAISELSQKGIISGDGNGNYRKDDSVKREEFLKTVLLVFGFNTTDGESGFKDVNKNDWFCPYVSSAKQMGLINGLADGTFGAGMPISRQDMAVMIYNAAKLKNVIFTNKGGQEFKDSGSVSDYARQAVEALSGRNIIHGNENGEFNPHKLCTRAEMAVMLQRVLTMMN